MPADDDPGERELIQEPFLESGFQGRPHQPLQARRDTVNACLANSFPDCDIIDRTMV